MFADFYECAILTFQKVAENGTSVTELITIHTGRSPECFK